MAQWDVDQWPPEENDPHGVARQHPPKRTTGDVILAVGILLAFAGLVAALAKWKW